jgi:hypothetical protein
VTEVRVVERPLATRFEKASKLTSSQWLDVIVCHVELVRGESETHAECLEIGFLAGPTPEERSPASFGRELVKSVSLGYGQDAINQWLEVHVRSNALDIDAKLAITPYGDDSQVLGTRRVEPQPTRHARGDFRLAAWPGNDTKRGWLYAQIAG